MVDGSRARSRPCTTPGGVSKFFPSVAYGRPVAALGLEPRRLPSEDGRGLNPTAVASGGTARTVLGSRSAGRFAARTPGEVVLPRVVHHGPDWLQRPCLLIRG